MRSHIITFAVIVAAIFVGLFLYDEFHAKRPVDDFGVGVDFHIRVSQFMKKLASNSEPGKSHAVV